MFVYYVILKTDGEEKEEGERHRSNSQILPPGEHDSFRVIPEYVAGIEPAPGDAGVSARRSCGLCCALNKEQGAEGEELDEGGEHLDK